MIIHTCISGLELVDKVNGAVGLATPRRTGAIKLSAVSHNSSIDNFIIDWKIRLALANGEDKFPSLI